MEKIKNPKTQRYIYIEGDTYKKLISNNEYTSEYLLSLPKITANKPMSPKNKNIKTVNTINIRGITGVEDVDKLLLYKTNDIYSLCQTNQYLYNLCMKDVNIKEKFFKQQKIHYRLKKIFNYILNNNVYLEVKNYGKDIIFFNIQNNKYFSIESNNKMLYINSVGINNVRLYHFLFDLLNLYPETLIVTGALMRKKF